MHQIHTPFYHLTHPENKNNACVSLQTTRSKKTQSSTPNIVHYTPCTASLNVSHVFSFLSTSLRGIQRLLLVHSSRRKKRERVATMPADIGIYTLTCSLMSIPPHSSAQVSFLVVIIVLVSLVFICDALVLFFYRKPLVPPPLFFLLQEIFAPASTACRYGSLVIGNGREYLELGLEVFAKVHNGGNIAAAVTVVWRRPHRYDILVLEVVFVAFVD